MPHPAFVHYPGFDAGGHPWAECFSHLWEALTSHSAVESQVRRFRLPAVGAEALPTDSNPWSLFGIRPPTKETASLPPVERPSGRCLPITTTKAAA